MNANEVIQELRTIQDVIEGDNFTWEAIEDLIGKLAVEAEIEDKPQ